MQKCFLLLLVLGFAPSAFGQSNYAVVTGTVSDPQHLPVVGASVEFRAASTGAVRRVVTNQRGVFEVPALLPDDYVSDVGVRLSIYKRLASAIDEAEVASIAIEMEDRFGAPPESACP